jgi:hypothetical protein
LLKKSAIGTWQRRYFVTQTHYLCYKVKKNAKHFAGGVDLTGIDSDITIEGKVITVTGLSADVSRGARELRTIVLKARSASATPNLQEWYTKLVTAREALRQAARWTSVSIDGSDAPEIFKDEDVTNAAEDRPDSLDLFEVVPSASVPATPVVDAARVVRESASPKSAGPLPTPVAIPLSAAPVALVATPVAAAPSKKASPKSKRRFGAAMRAGLKSGKLAAAVATIPDEPAAAAPRSSARRKRRISVSQTTVIQELDKNKISYRKKITVVVPDAGALGLRLMARYDQRTSRIVVEVANVAVGSKMDVLGIRVGDWIDDIHDVHIDLMNSADLNHDGKISVSELDQLLTSIRSLSPSTDGSDDIATAAELMSQYDLEGNHVLNPEELTDLVNDEVLDAIVRLVTSAPRPVDFSFARLDTEAVLRAMIPANAACTIASAAVAAATLAAEVARAAALALGSADAATHAAKGVRKRGRKRGSKRRNSMIGSAAHDIGE